MPVSLSGLDMSWLKDPEKRLPPRKKVKRKLPDRRSTAVASPYVMGDIKPFVSPVGEDNEVISSRPQLREHEKKHNVVQTGNDFPVGSIGAKNEAKKAKLIERAKFATEWV